MLSSSEKITTITDYLDVTTPLPDRADLLFIFGTRLETPALIASELYQRNIAPYIVLTGGSNRYTWENEAEAHYRVLVKAGIPKDKIIIENQSNNTLENVTFARPLIEKKIGVDSIQSVVAICKWMHSRRALMTLKRHFPDGIRYYAHTYEPKGITREDWHQHLETESAKVIKHWESIPQYLELGHIEEITPDGDAFI